MPQLVSHGNLPLSAVFRSLLILAFSLGFVGCATRPLPFTPDSRAPVEQCRQHGDLTDPKLFQIYIDPAGHLLDPENEEPIAISAIPIRNPNPAGVNDASSKIKAIKERVAKEEAETEVRYVDRIISTFSNLRKADSRYELAIFIHGGLNSFESTTERVADLRQPMLDECKYPLFISWNSGWGSNYSDHLLWIHRGVQSPRLASVLSPLTLAEDITRSVFRAAPALINNNHQTFSTRESNALKDSIASIAEGNTVNLRPFFLEELLDRKFSIPDPYTLVNPVRFAAIPFVDGFGSGSYNSMIRRTELVLRKERDDSVPNGKVPSTAATRFFIRWQEETESNPILSGASLSLFAHSMGTLIANDIISNFPRIMFDRIVYMAAACRVSDLKSVANYLLINPAAHFFNLSLHPQRDVWERSYADFTPRGSLLIWIDQFLGSVNSFGDRTAGFLRNIAPRAADLFDDSALRGRVTMTVFSDQLPSPIEHGDFDAYRFWRPAFWTADDCTPIRVPDGLSGRSQGCFEYQGERAL